MAQTELDLPGPAPTDEPRPPGRRRRRDGRRLAAPVAGADPGRAVQRLPAASRAIYLGFTDARAGLNQVTDFIGLDNFSKLLEQRPVLELVPDRPDLGVLGDDPAVRRRARARAAAQPEPAAPRLARTLALIPWAMPPVVVAIMWRLIYTRTTGPVNGVARHLGLPGNINWLGDFTTALPGGDRGRGLGRACRRRPSRCWPACSGSTAAARGGRGRRRRRLAPVLLTSRCRSCDRSSSRSPSLDFIWNFNSFGLVYVLTEGGPGGKTMLPMLFAYNEAFRYGNFGVAAAMGNVMVVRDRRVPRSSTCAPGSRSRAR